MGKQKAYIDFTKITTKKVGLICRRFRSEIMEIRQQDVAKELQVSQRIVSAFELGQINSLSIFMYYVSKGLLKYIDIKEIEIYASRFLYEHHGY